MEEAPDKEDDKPMGSGGGSDQEWRADGDGEDNENQSKVPSAAVAPRQASPLVGADEANSYSNKEGGMKTERPLVPAPSLADSEKKKPVVGNGLSSSKTPLYPGHIDINDGGGTCMSSVTGDMGVHAAAQRGQLYPSAPLHGEQHEGHAIFQNQSKANANNNQSQTKAQAPSNDDNVQPMEEVDRKLAAAEPTIASDETSDKSKPNPIRSLVEMERDIASKGHVVRVQTAPLPPAEHRDCAMEPELASTGSEQRKKISPVAVGVQAEDHSIKKKKKPSKERSDNKAEHEPSEDRSSGKDDALEQAMLGSSGEVLADSNALPSDTAMASHRPPTEPGAYSVRTPARFRPRGEANTSGIDLGSSSISPAVAAAAAAAASNAAPMAPVTATLAPLDSPDNISAEDEENENGGEQQSNGYKPCLVLEARRIEPESPIQSKHFLMVIVLVMVAIVVILSLGLAGVFVDSESSSSSSSDVASTVDTSFVDLGNANETNAMTTTPRLQQIRDRGYLTCTVVPNPSFMAGDPVIEKVGDFNPAFCHAVAAAIWGPETRQDRVKIVDYDFFNLDYQPTDVNPIGVIQKMQRNVYQSNGTGETFTAPFLFDGYTVSGDPYFVDCFDNKSFKHVDECQDLLLCVPGQNTGWESFASTVLPDRKIKSIDDFNGVMEAFVDGQCNIFLIFALGQSELVIRNAFGYEGNYTVGAKFYTRESRAVVTQSDDTEWSLFVSVVVQTLLAAELHNITQATAHLMPQTDVFGDDYKDMLKNVIGTMGNYGEVHDRYLGPVLPRAAVNSINNGSTGLLYALPLDKQPQAPEFNDRDLGPRLHRVLERGRLLCGVRYGRPGFAMTSNGIDVPVSGMDIDFCRAVGASLFGGDVKAVEFVEVVDQAGGFQMLANGEVDLVAGASWNLVNSVREPATGIGFAFSQPYFYNPDPSDSVEPNLCLATMLDDHDWKTYVYYIVAGTIYAEEKGIVQRFYNNMPLVYVYGDRLRFMFRDAILAVGSYADIFERNLETRSGRNLLNPPDHPGPGLYPMPGIIV